MKRIENSRDTPFEEHLGLDPWKCKFFGGVSAFRRNELKFLASKRIY